MYPEYDEHIKSEVDLWFSTYHKIETDPQIISETFQDINTTSKHMIHVYIRMENKGSKKVNDLTIELSNVFDRDAYVTFKRSGYILDNGNIRGELYQFLFDTQSSEEIAEIINNLIVIVNWQEERGTFEKWMSL